MTRSAYGMKQSCIEDFCCLACLPCSANRVYQTTKTRGNPTMDGGIAFNDQKVDECPSCKCCLAAIFCTPCLIGDQLQKAMKMPFLMGCCCVNPISGMLRLFSMCAIS